MSNVYYVKKQVCKIVTSASRIRVSDFCAPQRAARRTLVTVRCEQTPLAGLYACRATATPSGRGDCAAQLVIGCHCVRSNVGARLVLLFVVPRTG
jgi:hypothetical protein